MVHMQEKQYRQWPPDGSRCSVQVGKGYSGMFPPQPAISRYSKQLPATFNIFMYLYVLSLFMDVNNMICLLE